MLFSGSKKQVSKVFKSLVQLYSSYSSEIVDLLLEHLLKMLRSSGLVEHLKPAFLGPTIKNILGEWRTIIIRFWDKEPELILNLLKELLIMIETQEAVKYEEGRSFLSLHIMNFSLTCFGGVGYKDHTTSLCSVKHHIL